MADFVYHYTSRAATQSILAVGEIVPGSGGRIYFTDQLFGDGATARDRLAIRDTPAELCFAVERIRVRGLRWLGPVSPIKKPPYHIRKGGAGEYITTSRVSIADATTIQLKVP